MNQLFAIIISLVQFNLALRFERNGDFTIGGIFPLSTADGSGKCAAVNAKGIALTEAIANAIDRISSDSTFQNLWSTTKIGFDIRDGCSDVNLERSVAFQMSMEALNYQHNRSIIKPVDIVASEFGRVSFKSLHVLSIEDIPMISYSSNNLRLRKDKTMQASAVALLASVYPENVMKMAAVADIIKEYKFQYVNVIISDDYQGIEGMNVLTSRLNKTGYHASKILVSSQTDIDDAVKTISKNKRISVIVVHCTKTLELLLYKKLYTLNAHDLTFISTQNWHYSLHMLKPYTSFLDGMIYIHFNKDNEGFKSYLKTLRRPYTGKDWIRRLYYSYGGSDSCLSGVNLTTKNSATQHCFDAENQVTDALVRFVDISVYAFDAVYAIAHALKDKLQSQTVLSALKQTQFRIPILQDEIRFTNQLTVAPNGFTLYNLQGNKPTSVKTTWVGSWVQNPKPPQNTNLLLTKRDLRWKNNSLTVPVSSCSEMCHPGLYQVPLKNQTHCWNCFRCPNGTVSNITNAKSCFSCPKGTVNHPKQNKCVVYKLKRFRWFGPVGAIIIVLIVLGVACTLFAFGVVTQKRNYELVELSGYKLLCFYLIGCFTLFLSPIPLLAEPTVNSCSCYIGFFNIALTIIFSVLISRSQLINDFFDEEGNVKNGGCGKYPRTTCIIAVISIQLILLITGLVVAPPETLANETDVWNVRYLECSSWSSYVFWIALGYNIILSIVGNFLSCSSKKMEDTCEELKYIIISYCFFYLGVLFEIVIFHRYVDTKLAEAQSFMCIIFGFAFLFIYIWPKIYVILFRSQKDGKSIQKASLLKQEEGSLHITTAIHASAGFRHHGVVQMRIKESFDNE